LFRRLFHFLALLSALLLVGVVTLWVRHSPRRRPLRRRPIPRPPHSAAPRPAGSRRAGHGPVRRPRPCNQHRHLLRCDGPAHPNDGNGGIVASAVAVISSSLVLWTTWFFKPRL